VIKRLQIFLGPTGSRVLVALAAITGLLSLILNTLSDQYTWVQPVQSVLALIFLLGAVVIFLIRVGADERRRWVAILIPALGALFIGLFVVPQYGLLLLGAAVGWVITGAFISRGRGPMEYREAIKLLRKNDYAAAIKVMDGLIKSDPEKPNHYKFRAELYRLWGKLRSATLDYEKMTALEPDSPVGFNGLAEVYLQKGDYAEALTAAQKANHLAPADWVTFYNLGMIEDRLQLSSQVVEHLEQALALKVKDTRHRLLIHFYLARAYGRLKQTAKAQAAVEALKKHVTGLEEWQTILKSDQAETLRTVIGDDVQTALELIRGELTVQDLEHA
jgi:tetratricopeptide (TPR) repeat protein